MALRQHQMREQRTLGARTTLWLLVAIGSTHNNNVHMHKIPLCSTPLRNIVVSPRQAGVARSTYLQGSRLALSFSTFDFT